MEWDLRLLASRNVSEDELARAQRALGTVKDKIAPVRDAFQVTSRLINPGEQLITYAPMKLYSRAYFKLWEVLVKYPLLNPQARRIHTLHLCEAPGSFVQAVEVYWTKTCGRPRDLWAYHGVTLRGALEWKSADQTSVVYADLTKDELPPSCYHADLVTGDGGFEVDDGNQQEQANHTLLAAQITKAVKCCRPGGAIYIKMFDMFRRETRDLIEQEALPWFEFCLIIKPFGSRVCNSERFLLGLRRRDQKETLPPDAPGARLREVALGLVDVQTAALTKALALAAEGQPLDPGRQILAEARQFAAAKEIAAWLGLTT